MKLLGFLFVFIFIVKLKCNPSAINKSPITYDEILSDEKLQHYSLVIYPKFVSALKNCKEKDEYKLEYMCMMYCHSVYQEIETGEKCVEKCMKDIGISFKPVEEVYENLFGNISIENSLVTDQSIINIILFNNFNYLINLKL